MSKKFPLLLALAIACTFVTTAPAQIVVDTVLGPLGIASSTNLSGDTTGANRNVDLYPNTSPFDESLGEHVFEFSIADPAEIGIINNEGIFAGSDHDHYLLTGLTTTFDADFNLNLADSDVGFVDEQGSMGIFPAGTYYLSVDTFAGSTEEPYDIDLTLDAPAPAPTSVFLGTTGNDIDANTFGSDIDTELGVYDAIGNLLGNNDDAGGTLQSQLVGTLPNGLYYAAVGEFDTLFFDGFDVLGGGGTGGGIQIAVNALNASGALASAGDVAWYSFEVIPEPSSFALIGMALMGVLGIARRRDG